MPTNWTTWKKLDKFLEAQSSETEFETHQAYLWITSDTPISNTFHNLVEINLFL